MLYHVSAVCDIWNWFIFQHLIIINYYISQYLDFDVMKKFSKCKRYVRIESQHKIYGLVGVLMTLLFVVYESKKYQDLLFKVDSKLMWITKIKLGFEHFTCQAQVCVITTFWIFFYYVGLVLLRFSHFVYSRRINRSGLPTKMDSNCKEHPSHGRIRLSVFWLEHKLNKIIQYLIQHLVNENLLRLHNTLALKSIS